MVPANFVQRYPLALAGTGTSAPLAPQGSGCPPFESPATPAPRDPVSVGAAQSALGSAQAAIPGLLGDDFAGVFIDESAGACIIVYSVRSVDGATLSRVRQLFPPGVIVANVQVPYSATELHTVASSVSKQRASLQRQGIVVTALAIDTRNDIVNVGLTNQSFSQAAARDLVGRFGPVAITSIGVFTTK